MELGWFFEFRNTLTCIISIILGLQVRIQYTPDLNDTAIYVKNNTIVLQLYEYGTVCIITESLLDAIHYNQSTLSR